MKKKTTILLICLVAIMGLLTGCGKKKLDPFDPKIFNVSEGEEGVYIIYDYVTSEQKREVSDFSSCEEPFYHCEIVIAEKVEYFKNYRVKDLVNNIPSTDPRSYLTYAIQFPSEGNSFNNENEEIIVKTFLPIELEDKYELKNASTTINVPKIDYYAKYSATDEEAKQYKEEMIKIVENCIENAPNNYGFSGNVYFNEFKGKLLYGNSSLWNYWDESYIITTPIKDDSVILNADGIDTEYAYVDFVFSFFKSPDGKIRPFCYNIQGIYKPEYEEMLSNKNYKLLD